MGFDSIQPSPDKFHKSSIKSEETQAHQIQFMSETLFTKTKRTCRKGKLLQIVKIVKKLYIYH